MHVKFRSFVVGSLAVIGVGMIGSAFVPKAHADAWDKKTIVTVNEPIIAGNKVLDPGTYVWKLMDSPSDRHVVQIFDKDQRHIEATILATPNYKQQADGKTQFTFWETPAGVPKAVRAWFYPGDNFGQEFPYPKKLVAQLAAAAPVPIPADYHEAQPEPAPAPAPEAEAPQPAPEPAAPAAAPEPAPEPQAAPVAPAATPTPAALPHTASFNPLIGVIGLILVSMAGLLTLADKRA
jgi:pyruvate/2-oxoglutarate dehydrogenase complex dihydrolipoamide acyltransferase (E2) component